MRRTACERGAQVARGSSGIVAGLTAAAVAVVAFLAYQASANAPDSVAAPPTSASASASAKPSTKKPEPAADPLVVPTGSGTGPRVVYALKQKRVWLVGADGKASRTFEVVPSSISPAPGTFAVFRRTGATEGSDGVPIEHVVLFAEVGDSVVGFSAAQDGSLPTPDPTVKAGGVRMTREDADALWNFATIDTKVVVVP
ncbi:L,D-transpeptidase [Streptomyces sp. NBC_01218]|uniref:L,D-transpeptidase n=1 Tax=Streptomyces sp. NBC_01218 TaxID=2903780 RepID=UPI003FA3B522